MGRYKLRTPQQPWPLRLGLGVYEFCASLKLAVVLIFSAAAVLGWATFVESSYGARAVHFGIYGTWWFTLLGALLAVNIFCAAVIRYPWKRHQTGFVITHIGLLTLLLGCLVSRQGGIDAQMPIFEDNVGNRAFEDSEHFQLSVRRLSGQGVPDADETVIKVPFRAGPFNWDDYDPHWAPPLRLASNSEGALPRLEWTSKKLYWFPWSLPRRDRGVIYDSDGIRLEVLDYYADSERIDAPYVKLWMTSPRMSQMGADGKERSGPESWVPVELFVRPTAFRQYPQGVGSHEQRGGGSFVFMLAGSPAMTEAFLRCLPEPAAGDKPLGERGQVVLYAGGQTHRFLVDEKLGQPRFPLGETGLEVEVVRTLLRPKPAPNAQEGELKFVEDEDETSPQSQAVELRVLRGESTQTMLLFADAPELNIYDYANGVFGSYWVDRGEKSSADLLRGKGESRIDILQGDDQKLYYRYWNRRRVVVAAELPTDGAKVDAFKMPIAQLRMYVDRFVPSREPGKQIIPRPFSKKTLAVSAFRAAQVRLTVDGRSEEFWLWAVPPDARGLPPGPSELKQVASPKRQVVVSMPLDEVNLGFRVRLRDFEMRLDPGTSQPSHYSSWVDFVDLEDDGRRLRTNEFITMNAPVDFIEPVSRRNYRMFQESYMGPWKPGDPQGIFARHVAADSDRDQLYASVLTVNYDPGRWLKYQGSLLVVVGIATMFYMRAYFFKPQGKPPAGRTAAAARPAKAAARQPVA